MRRNVPDDGPTGRPHHYDARTIRTRLRTRFCWRACTHIRPAWRSSCSSSGAIQRDIGNASATRGPMIPMANGGVAHGWVRARPDNGLLF